MSKDTQAKWQMSVLLAIGIAVATGAFSTAWTQHADNARVLENLEDLEEQMKHVTAKTINRFTRTDGDVMRERIHVLEVKVALLEK